MTTQVVSLPLMGIKAGFRRFSVAEYHRLAEIGVLTEDDNLELIEGWLIHKLARNPPHDGTMHQVLDLLITHLPVDWKIRIQSAITLAESEPEPDLAIVRKDSQGYRHRHPSAADVGLVIEVSDSTVDGDRIDKGRIYARACIPIYWLVNIPDRQIEVYTSPTMVGAVPAYGQRQDLHPGDSIPFVLTGHVVTTLAVSDIIR
jgi:Uma2 family endonuclease